MVKYLYDKDRLIVDEAENKLYVVKDKLVQGYDLNEINNRSSQSYNDARARAFFFFFFFFFFSSFINGAVFLLRSVSCR